MRVRIVEPSIAELLDFCARDPVERVFLEDVARRGHGRFAAVRDRRGVTAVCHLGANVVPSGEGCGAFAERTARARPLMLIGEEAAVSELWEAGRRSLPPAREDRPGQPVYAISEPPAPGGSGLRPATSRDLELLVPACAASHAEELGYDPLRADADGFRWRTRMQIESGRSWLWVEGGTILFKAEASAWTPSAVQLAQVWVDPVVRRHGYASRGLRDLVRVLLDSTPTVCLFVRTDNAPAISLYDSIEMRRVLTYRSVLL